MLRAGLFTWCHSKTLKHVGLQNNKLICFHIALWYEIIYVWDTSLFIKFLSEIGIKRRKKPHHQFRRERCRLDPDQELARSPSTHFNHTFESCCWIESHCTPLPPTTSWLAYRFYINRSTNKNSKRGKKIDLWKTGFLMYLIYMLSCKEINDVLP